MPALARKRFRPTRLKREEFHFDHPFLMWFAAHHARGQGATKATPMGGSGTPGVDFIMGELASRRFSIGVDSAGEVALGIARDEIESIMSIPWGRAALLRQVQGQEWVVLHCADARLLNSKLSEPLSWRLWLPASSALFDGWLAIKTRPETMLVVEANIIKGRPMPTGEHPVGSLPLSFKGRWEPEPAQLTAPEARE
jgi:hypothetical protein